MTYNEQTAHLTILRNRLINVYREDPKGFYIQGLEEIIKDRLTNIEPVALQSFLSSLDDLIKEITEFNSNYER